MRSSTGFKADGEPDEAVVAERLRERLRVAFGVLLVGDEGLVVAERDRGGDDTQVVDERQPVGVGAADGERDDPAECARQLSEGRLVLVVARQAGVGDVHDARVVRRGTPRPLGRSRTAAAGAAGAWWSRA